MLAFSMEVKEWMAQDKDNIIVVHCKGGKGKNVLLFISLFLKKFENFNKGHQQDMSCYEPVIITVDILKN